MCLSTPKPKATPPPPAPPPPAPEGGFAENPNPDLETTRRRAEGTEQLRVRRSSVGTGDTAGLQISRPVGPAYTAPTGSV